MRKRAFDVVAALVGLVFFGPVMALVALAVMLDSGRPILFRQDRVGLGGRPFAIHKFRTMVMVHDGHLVSAKGDPRVTRVGRLLRKSKLDELPQLLDVLNGSMSVVGPRPEVQDFVRKWPDADRDLILSVRPGITDRASIENRDEAAELASVDDPAWHYEHVILPRKVRSYVAYVHKQSMLEDIRIIAATAMAILR